MLTNTQKVARARKILQIAADITKNAIAQSRIEEIELHTRGYAEPGYAGELVATGNWNEITTYNKKTNKFTTVDSMPKRVCECLEKVGFEIEWSDEWTTCIECGRLVRVVADSYSWMRAFVDDENGDTICHECVQESAADYLQQFENNPRRAWTLHSVDPTEHGYVSVCKEFEHGAYGGQSDDPNKIAANLRAMGVTRFIFAITDVGQFDMRFNVLIHESELELFSEEAFAETDIEGADPAIIMQNALMNLPPLDTTQPGIQLHKINNDGSVSSRVISPEEFVEKGIRE